MMSNALIRPAWTPATIAMMVVGFMLYWPLGLAVLAYIIWGERLEGWRQDVNRSTDRFCAGLRRSGVNTAFSRSGTFSGAFSGMSRAERTGNVAFDEWRDKELSRLDEERRKLHEAHAEFEAYARELRRAKDQEEFDRFMNRRRNGKSGSETVIDG